MRFQDKFFSALVETSGTTTTTKLIKLDLPTELLSLQTLQTLFKDNLTNYLTHIALKESTSLEYSYQNTELSYVKEKINTDNISYPDDLAVTIQRTSDYLGREFCHIRWLMERSTPLGKAQVKYHLNSASDHIRKCFNQGIKCLESDEPGYAYEYLNEVINKDRTNYFAYQYLGLIAVTNAETEAAIKYFTWANKFTNNSYYKALSFSYLANCQYSAGEPQEAFKLAHKAVEQHKDLALFWHQLAQYAALLGETKRLLSAIKNSIKCDSLYWAVILLDPHFDKWQAEIYALLQDMRSKQQEKATQVLQKLPQALELGQNAGVLVSKFTPSINNLTERVTHTSIFNFLEIIASAQDLYETILQQSEKNLRERIADKNSLLAKQEGNNERELKELEATIGALVEKLKGLLRDYYPWHPNFRHYLLFHLVGLVVGIIMIYLLMPQIFRANYQDFLLFGVIIVLFIALAVTIIIAQLYSRIDYYIKVTQPQKQLNNELVLKRREVRDIKAKLTENHKNNRAKIGEEIKQLEATLMLCQSKTYERS